MIDTPEERCSCNARLKHKCSKESTLGGGKMCLRGLEDILKECDGKMFSDIVSPSVMELDVHQVGKFLTAEQLDTTKYLGTEHLDMHTLNTVYNMMKSEEDKQWIGFLIANKLKH